MKRLLLGMLTVMMLVISGCGEVIVEPAIYPPSISSYSFSQNRTTEFINGEVVFYAPDSDIDYMVVVAYDSRGYEWSRKTTFINRPGTTQGIILFSIDYFSFPNDAYPYTFSIYLTDFNGNTSNQAVDTFFVP